MLFINQIYTLNLGISAFFCLSNAKSLFDVIFRTNAVFYFINRQQQAVYGFFTEPDVQ